MRLSGDLSVLFAVLISVAFLLWPNVNKRDTGTFVFAIALVVLVFLLVAITVEVENLRKKVEELESYLETRRGGESHGLEG